MASKTANRSVKLEGIETEFGPVYLTPSGIKAGHRGRVQDPLAFLSGISDKGLRRKIRRASRAVGRLDVAAARVL